MDKKLQDKLFEKHESFFYYHGEKTLIYDFEIDDGWYSLVDELCEELSTINKKYDISIIAVQVKEKLGTLRFYYSFAENNLNTVNDEDYSKINKEIFTIVNKYYYKSETTCEACGRDGKMNKTGWMKVLCSDCDQKILQKQKCLN